MKQNNQSRRKMALLLIAFLVSAVILGALIYRKYEMSRLKPAPPLPRETGALLVTLFFASPDGSGLVREAREIDACADPTACAEELLEELINGPMGDMSPTLPATTTFRSVRIAGDTAIVDFGKEFFDSLPPGSNAGMTAVYSVTDSLAFNFPQVKQVKFLLEGEKLESLGNLDLSAPLAPDFTLEKKQ